MRVAVIGAGVVGSLITRALSRYNIKVALLERCNDCAMGATKANSAIVHAGFDAVPGTLKAKLNVRGVELMKKVCKELNVPLKNNEALVVAFSEEEIPHLEMLKDRGEQNGVPGLRIVRREELVELEPNIGDTAVGALVAPTSSIVCPYELTIAVLPFILFIIANWCFTTLFDGEGSLKDIFIACCYALLPIVLIFIPTTIASNFVLLEELDLVNVLNSFAFIWAGLLIFSGMMITHDYTVSKNFVTVLGTLIAMVFVMFVAILFTTLVAKIVSFIANIVTEIGYRL